MKKVYWVKFCSRGSRIKCVHIFLWVIREQVLERAHFFPFPRMLLPFHYHNMKIGNERDIYSVKHFVTVYVAKKWDDYKVEVAVGSGGSKSRFASGLRLMRFMLREELFEIRKQMKDWDELWGIFWRFKEADQGFS